MKTKTTTPKKATKVAEEKPKAVKTAKSPKKAPPEKKGLEQLSEIMKGITLSVPKLATIPTLEGVGVTAKEKAANANRLEEDVTSAVRFLADKKLEACTDRRERRAVKEELDGPMAQMNTYIENVFGLADPLYKATVAVAFVKASLSQQFETHIDAAKMLASLVDRGLLIWNPRGSVMIGYTRYELGDFGLDVEDIAEICTVIDKFSRTLVQLESQRRQEQVQMMSEQSEITLDEALAGQNGKCLVNVPAESFMLHGQEKWRGGGNALFDFRANEVIPICASGAIERLIADLAVAGVKLIRHTLEWRTAPGSGESFGKLAEAIQRQRRCSPKEAEDHTKKIQTLWHILDRGVRIRKDEVKREEAKAEMEAKANITPVQFFGLNGNDGKLSNGTTLLSFEGVFKHDSGSILEPFFLANLDEVEGEKFFSIVEVPAHLEKNLKRFVGMQFSIGNDWDDLPDQLSRLVRGIRSQQEKAVQLASK